MQFADGPIISGLMPLVMPQMPQHDSVLGIRTVSQAKRCKPHIGQIRLCQPPPQQLAPERPRVIGQITLPRRRERYKDNGIVCQSSLPTVNDFEPLWRQTWQTYCFHGIEISYIG